MDCRRHFETNAGFMLIQQLLTLLFSALFMLLLCSTIVLQWRAFSLQSQQTHLQQTAVLAHTLLQRELSNAQFWAGLQPDGLSVAGAAVNGDCYSIADSGSFPQAGQHWLPMVAGPVGTNRTPQCLTNAVKQSDFIQVKHLGGDPLTQTELRSNRAYVQQDGWQGKFVSQQASGLTASSWYWPYVHELYYVAMQSLTGQQIPVLMRKRLIRNSQGNFAIDTAAVLDGVEMLVFEFGLDSDGDGQADQFLSGAQLSAAQWRQSFLIRQVRYFVLLRALQPEAGYQNKQQYQLGARRFQAKGDAFRRWLISSSVAFP